MADIDPVDKNMAFSWQIETGQQTDQCGFATARVTDKGNGLTGFYFKADIVQHFTGISSVLKSDLLIMDIASGT